MNLLQTFIVILCVLNPIGGMNLYINLLDEIESCRVKIFVISFLCISCSLIIVAAFAQPLLNLLGFPLYAIHLGGGVLLVIIGVLNMLKMPDNKKPILDNTAILERPAMLNKNIVNRVWLGVNPISLASLSPAVIIVDLNYSFMAQSLGDKIWLVVTLLSSSLFFCGLLMGARLIKGKLSAGGMLFITRLIGLFITAMAFQMIVSGIVSVVPLVLGDSLSKI